MRLLAMSCSIQVATYKTSHSGMRFYIINLLPSLRLHDPIPNIREPSNWGFLMLNLVLHTSEKWLIDGPLRSSFKTPTMEFFFVLNEFIVN